MKKCSLLTLLMVLSACVFSQTVPVMVAIQGPNTVCSAPATPVTYTAIAANAPNNYFWSVTPATGVVVANPNSSVTSISFPNTNSTYTVSCQASNGAGSSAPITVTVAVFETPTVTFSGASIFCQGSSTNLSASPTIISASSTLSYSWSPTTGISNPASGTVVANPTVTTTYAVLLTIGSCTNTAPVTITVLPKPTVNTVTSPSVICPGNTSTITISGTGVTFSVNGLPSSLITTVNPTVSTLYLVGTTGANGCKAFTNAIVQVTPNPFYTIASNPTGICPGKSANIFSSPGVTITSVNGSPVFTNVVQVNPLVNTSYTVTAVNAVGCNLFSGVTVSMLPVPGVTASLLPAIICKGEKSTLNLSGTAQAYSVNTVASPLTVTVNPTSTAVYTVDGTGSNGCTGKTTATLTVNLCTEIGEEATEGLAVYPNPSNGTFTLQASVDAGVIIYDQLGKITRLFRTARGGCEVQGLAPGLYLITTGPFKKKIIVTE